MSRQMEIALYECETAVGHATAHLTTVEQICTYERLIASWQQTVKDLKEDRRCPHGYERDDLATGASTCEQCSE